MDKYQYVPVSALIITLLLLNTTNTTQANEHVWPQFRGPGGLGIASDDQHYPVELDMSRNLLWKTEVPRGHSSPCIWEARIFITACSGKNLETICIDRENGTVKWRKAIEPKTMEKVDNSNSHATPTPVCDGKRVYVYFGSFGLLAYDLDGNEDWRKSLPIPNIQYGSAASPILANDMLIINCDPAEGAYILAVDRDNGKTIWKQDRPIEQAGWSTPVFWKHGNQEELVVLGSHKLISYDLKDGQKRWWLYNLPVRATCTPVYANDTLFVESAAAITGDPVNPIELPDFKELLENYDSNKDGRLVQEEIPEDLAFIYRMGPRFTGIKERFSSIDNDQDGAIGKTEWEQVEKQTAMIQPRRIDALVAIRSGGKGEVSQSHIKWRANEGIGQVPSPLVYKSRVYLVKHGGNVTCFNAETGDRIYCDKLGPRVYYNASPIAGDDKIYFCSLNGVVIIIQAGDIFKVLSRNRIEERIYATPALVDGNIYLRTDKCMYAFGE
jgi:outer membrane protein assembly factor BamB